MNSRRKVGIGGAVAAALTVVVLLAPGLSAAATPSLLLSAPYTGMTVRSHHHFSIMHCAASATAKDVVPASFNQTTGNLRMGSATSTGCSTNVGNAYANASEHIDLSGPAFNVSVIRAYTVAVVWSLTFTFSFSSTFVNSSNGGLSAYAMRINVSLLNQSSNQSYSVGAPYLNSTSCGGCTGGSTVTYTNVQLKFSSPIVLATGARYSFQIHVSEFVMAWAYGPGGLASTSLNVGTQGNDADLLRFSVK